MKKIVSLLLAMMMVFAMSATAFAKEADLTNHTYKAYQIFSGTQSTESQALGQIVWGNGVNSASLLAALNENTAYASCQSAADVADVLDEFEEDSAEARAFAKIVYNYIDGDGEDVKDGDTLPVGYYLIVDTTNVSGQNDVKNLALLELTGDGTVVIENKTSVPEVVKKVQDTNDTTGATTDWQDSADYDINDDVPFQLTATLGDSVSDYDTYKVVFHDTLSSGLTYNRDAVIKVGSNVVTEEFDIKYEGNKLTISCDNVKAQAVGAGDNSVITVVYTAKLNENAVIGSAGNPNTVKLEYSNNPNVSGEGDDHPTGETPEDKVTVFTYKLVVDKVDKEGNKLTGATFELYKKNATEDYVIVGEAQTGETTSEFTWEGLDDGDYKLVETQAPAGYNIGEPIEFTITAEHEVISEDPQLTKLNEGDNVFVGSVSTATITTAVENNKGAVLPSTGGMGTTLFYVAGLAMMFTAAGAFVARKRMTF